MVRHLVSFPSKTCKFLETPDLLETPGGGGKMKISQTTGKFAVPEEFVLNFGWERKY